MTKPISCGEPLIPVLMVLFQYPDGTFLHAGEVVAQLVRPSDIASALASLPPADRAEVVGDESVWVELAAATRNRDAAVARAETAERERDNAQRDATGAVKRLAEEQLQNASLRSDLERTAKVEAAAKVVVERYADHRVYPGRLGVAIADLATVLASNAVDALTAPAAEGKAEPKRSAFLTDLEKLGPRYICTDCGRQSGTAQPYGCPGDCEFVGTDAETAEPDPNEREELGMLLYAQLWPSFDWDASDPSMRETYIRSASAVASRVRAKDGGRETAE